MGGIPPRPSKNEQPAARAIERGAEQKNFLFLLEEKIGGARKPEIVKSILLGGERQRAAAGRLPLVKDF